jgi:hypothetical protein
MGIWSSMAKIMISEFLPAASPKEGSSVLTLGVQHFNYSLFEAMEMFREAQVDPVRLRDEDLVKNFRISGLKPSALDASVLFKMLGFSQVFEMDSNKYEQASFIHDLNVPVGPELAEKFDLVFDGGTTEHVFDVRTSLSNIHKMVKTGGYVFHSLPLTGWVNHGFYQFCPNLLYEFYRANKFDNIQGIILCVNRTPESKAYWWKVKDFRAEGIRFNDFSTKTLLLFWARKTCNNEIVVPQQYYYEVKHELQSDSFPQAMQVQSSKPRSVKLRLFEFILGRRAAGYFAGLYAMYKFMRKLRSSEVRSFAHM